MPSTIHNTKCPGGAPEPVYVESPVESCNGHLRYTSQKADLSVLKQPITFPFSKRTAKNRFLKAPMTERLCSWNEEGQDISARGYPSDEYLHLYKLWGEGEIGIIISGNIMVRYDALEAYGNPILADDHDGRVSKFREMTNLAKAHGSLVLAQISHPGRQGAKHLNPFPVSASDVHLQIKHAGNVFAKPRALTVPEIHEMVRLWGETAYLCHQAGFDGVQVHCAHGYLLAQFLSPTTNLREDEYGSSFENRTRIVFEIIEEIRHRVPDPSFIICVKLNSVEFQHRGTTPEDALKFCMALEDARVDFVDLSGGTFEQQLFCHVKDSTKAREAYFLEFSEMIKPLLKHTKVYVTGGLRSAGGMVRAIQDGCDGIGIGRPLGQEPFLCKNILNQQLTGAIENFMPLKFTTQSTGTQLHQVGKGHRLISDYSVKEEVCRWIDANEKEGRRKEALLPKVDSSGYPDLVAESGFAYLNYA